MSKRLKILWFTNTPSRYKDEKNTYNGGGWIESLELLMSGRSNIDLAISFLHKTDTAKVEANLVAYYPILIKKKYGISRLVHNWSCKVGSADYLNNFLEVIDDHKPDVIHVFGTEGPFASIQTFTEIPVVIHLQGLLNPCDIAFYPPGVGKFNVLFSRHFIINQILGNSLLFTKRKLEKQAKRELMYFKSTKYVMGRTKWDESIIRVLAPEATYFHVNEVLRPPFYAQEQREFSDMRKTIIVSTISSTIYKGLDLILRTAKLLKEDTSLDFEWHVIGICSDDKLLQFFEGQLNISAIDFNIKMLGKKATNELIESLKEANIFVHPSYIDNSPNSVCEAQMLELPVIACNVGGLPSLIENNVTGLLVPSNSPFELANSIRTLASNNDLSSKLGRQARIKAMERHDREKIMLDIMSVYETLSNS